MLVEGVYCRCRHKIGDSNCEVQERREDLQIAMKVKVFALI